MKRKNWMNVISPLVMPALLVVLGVLLIVRPDSAATLIGKILAFSLLLAGTVLAIGALTGNPAQRIGTLLLAAILLALGLWLLTNPLFLAASLGRILGILLILEGASTVVGALHSHYPLPVMALLSLIAGVVLVLVPMTASRLVSIICGIGVLCLGVGELAEKLLSKKPPKKPDIIDIE